MQGGIICKLPTAKVVGFFEPNLMSKKYNGKSASYIIFDEPKEIRPKPIIRLNPAQESAWARIFRKWFKYND